jgi:hydrogenase expression/formation protein HypD
MTLKYVEEFRDPLISQRLVDQIKKISRKEIRLMEVCGTHTMAIFRSGIRSILPKTIQLISGPGCPVCVTAQKEIDAFLSLALRDEVIVTTFGDLMRVPGTRSSLQKERARGRDIRMVYSTFDALDVAQKNPGKIVVFLGVGFETTIPTIAASILSAKQMNIDNYAVFCAHKRVPPALDALMQMKSVNIDGFLLPGHVSVIIGMNAYQTIVAKYHIPAVIAGFEPTDILQAVYMLVEQVETGKVRLANAYQRAVSDEGNTKAQKMMEDVFEMIDTSWRGIGIIPKSGLKIRNEYAAFDAEKVFEITVRETEAPKGCVCGEILTGLKTPPDCSLFRKICTPMDPVGPCMVSSEGVCAAYYRYHHNV